MLLDAYENASCRDKATKRSLANGTMRMKWAKPYSRKSLVFLPHPNAWNPFSIRSNKVCLLALFVMEFLYASLKFFMLNGAGTANGNERANSGCNLKYIQNGCTQNTNIDSEFTVTSADPNGIDFLTFYCGFIVT